MVVVSDGHDMYDRTRDWIVVARVGEMETWNLICFGMVSMGLVL